MKENILNTETYFTTKWLYLNFYVFYTHFFIYLIACLIKIKQYQKNIKNYFSSLEKIKLTWLRTIIIAYFIAWGIDLFNVVINIITLKMNTFLWMSIFSASVMFVLANLMIFKGLQYPHLFIKTQSNSNQKKYKKSPLTKDMKTRYHHRLIEYVEKEKPYLNYNLTLGELSNKAKIPVNYLSQVINEVLNKNFYTFINEYRVNEAKRMFASPKYTNRSIMEILYEVGFNSKSTFYSFFQKTTGTTPSEYRKKINQQDTTEH
ncbi:MAG: helix-turn-helix transcriptional regulator [Candidatus Aminicenantes bacterium]|nr:helix-turn-helix transcriptional regulator [Candidatus Aminicenantes bacterium]